METKITKFSKYHYLVEVWDSSKMEWSTNLATERLKEAHEQAEYLYTHKDVECRNIRISRQTYYDVFCQDDEEYWQYSKSLRAELEEILEMLDEIKSHGYIAWTSPAPSSSECEVKRHVQNAVDAMIRAILNC